MYPKKRSRGDFSKNRNRNKKKFNRNKFGKHASTEKFSYTKNQFQKNKRKFGITESININRFISNSSEVKVQEKHVIQNSFKDFDFVEILQKNLQDKNYITPTPIQDQVIPHITQGSDVIGLASTGTGKTAAFLLPLINKLFFNKSQKVLIIVPTRELALQIDTEFKGFAKGMKLFSALCIGGMPMHTQLRNLKRKPQFVICTPGRIEALEKRNAIVFAKFKYVVLDEIDRMLDMGFLPSVQKILAVTHPSRQSFFFSATINPRIKILTEGFLNNPLMIEVNTSTPAKNIKQDIVRIEKGAIKFDTLKKILNGKDCAKVLIFNETKRGVEKLSVELNKHGFKTSALHGNKQQSQRQKILLSFRENRIKILVATDVAARGLDIDNVTHVINYTVPNTYDDYIHRIGRTGRADRAGVALTFV